MNKLSISYTSFAKNISAYAGLNLFDDLIFKFELRAIFGIFLPKKLRNRGISSWEKFHAGILGFVAGIECLDDFDWFGNDPYFSKITSPLSPITFGKFLRQFSLRQIESIASELPRIAFKMRRSLTPKMHKIIFSMDSSDHQQYGVKSEGVAFGYRKFLCLNSQNMFDDKGFCYGFKLRKGNTYSSEDAAQMIHHTLAEIPSDIKKYFRADSAYSSQEIYNTLLNQKCHFTICLKQNVWAPILTKNRKHLKWQKTKMRFFKSQDCEIASALYPLKGLAQGKTFLRVVFIRAPKSSESKENKFPYDYYAIVTDLSDSEMSHENILRFYRGRSEIENRIKDLKNGMDFHHFPCMSLKANNVWGLMGIIAYNLMRYASFAVVPNKGCFIKTTRRKAVLIAAEIITHARSIEVRMKHFFYQEVCRIKAMLNNSVFTVDANRLDRIPKGNAPN